MGQIKFLPERSSFMERNLPPLRNGLCPKCYLAAVKKRWERLFSSARKILVTARAVRLVFIGIVIGLLCGMAISYKVGAEVRQAWQERSFYWEKGKGRYKEELESLLMHLRGQRMEIVMESWTHSKHT